MSQSTSQPQPPPPDVPSATAQLRVQGAHTLGHETSLARSPMWAARASAKPVQLALLSGPLVLHGVGFRQVEGAQLTVADQRLVAELTTRFLLDGCPTTRAVNITLTEAASALGFEGGADGGEGRHAAKRSLARIRSVTFSSALSSDERFPSVWGLIDDADPIAPHGGRPRRVREAGYVTLGRRLAALLRAGHVTFLHYPTWDAIAREDALAGRLWCYLETDRITSWWNYSLFASPKDGHDDERYMPAIADMLLLDWPLRRQIAARIRRAAGVIARLDPRYDLEILRSKTAGMWYLRARRSGPNAARLQGTLPVAVRRGWQRAYGVRLPSSKQNAVLNEIAQRRGADWVGEQLSAFADSSEDALRATMDGDRRASSAALTAAKRAECEWQAAKARESSTAEESLAGIIRALAATDESIDENRQFQ